MDLHFPSRRGAARHSLPLALGLALCGLLAVPASARSAGPPRAGTTATRFACDRGVGFHIAFVRGGVWITTAGGRWLLRQAPSSIGRRYAAPGATFILDEDRAALVGLPGGPFVGCVALAPGGARRPGGGGASAGALPSA